MRRSTVVVLVCALVAQMVVMASGVAGAERVARPAEEPGNPFFRRTWERTDLPVSDGTVARTWMWGPQGFTGLVEEAYDESPNGRRTVQYFDKSRMEITSDPEIEPDSVWYVTNGLLVVELITGKMQIGDNRFVQRSPAQVNVAGDADDPSGPTYATFAGLLDAPALADGAAVTQRLSRDGTVTNDPALSEHGVIGLYHVQVEGIDHEIASPFWGFMNSAGTVYQDGGYERDDLFISPYYATGYPITEAYWARVKVADEYRDVLMQCFERRCLTYTPGNSAGFETEAGNVGQHYYAWRYAQAGDGGEILVNEVLFWPEDGDDAWIELVNPSDDPVDLTGWVVTNADKTRSALLPDWVLPKGGYLRIVFGEGQNRSSYRDGASWYTGSTTRFFDGAADGVALYRAGGPVGSPPREVAARATDAGSIVDYVAWSYGTQAPEGAAADDALGAGIWQPEAFVVTRPRLGPARVHLVAQGESIGRDRSGRDTNAAEDWSALGGADTYWTTPAEPNDGGDAFDPSTSSLPDGADDAGWTIMAYFDGRDPALFRDFIAEINRMEAGDAGPEVNVVVQLTWGEKGGNLAGARWLIRDDDERGVVTSPMETLAANRDPLNPGDPDALAAFIGWAQDEYPAERYALVLGGHGWGWKGLFTVGPEDDFLTMVELEDGLGALGRPFDVVQFDAPLMADVEVGYQIADVAEMMVASQEIVWGAYPWPAFMAEMEDDPGMSAGELADTLAQTQAELYDDWGLAGYTIASIDVRALARRLVPAIDELGMALVADLEDVRRQNDPLDNLQVVFKHEVQEGAEDFADTNFKDLADVAGRFRDLAVPSAVQADAVLDLLQDEDVVRWESSGVDHPSAHGLSIYWPHDEDVPDPTPKYAGPAGSRGVAPFDDPLFAPQAGGTHLYAQDALQLIPSLRKVNHPVRDDPDFRFPLDTGWDEFLHRYYKPVADACIVFGDECVGRLDVPVGTELELSAAGSSDSDGGDGMSDDLPGSAGSTHYYWDLDTNSDSGGRVPDYDEATLYGDCEDEDCDRDEVDELDDDLDAFGPEAYFTCEGTGEFTLRVMVWDEHHELGRQGHEDTEHNDGRHWLHFNVDDATVVVRCYDDARMVSEPETVAPNEELIYTITVPGSSQLSGPADAFIHDALPAEIELAGDGNIECSGGSGTECGYDAASRTVFWFGQLDNGDLATLRFTVRLVSSNDYPDAIENCADIHDGVAEGRVCATTTIENPAGSGPRPLEPGMPALLQDGDRRFHDQRGA